MVVLGKDEVGDSILSSTSIMGLKGKGRCIKRGVRCLAIHLSKK